MTNQEAFTKSAEHLLKQGKKSRTASGVCLYYGPNNLKCAVGALIPKNEYEKSLESHSVGHVAGVVGALHGLSISLLEDLQTVHDYGDPEDWAVDLHWVAVRHSLKFSRKLLKKGKAA